ncbi:membrane protein [Poseidonocella pacifica]|uniref:Membrane protein n=1 Tax=Poseidonocella pacifica TaxID=871651 RepID=A0A1I0WPC7_9RHOB|nr:YihY/virulence factor BrkB family protein [Poseidonocella pacifica]SFA90010.1 membrane protein [Poseidonocella pacifica]
MDTPSPQDRGQAAERPAEIPSPGWWDILKRTKDEIGRDHVSVVSAGVAFFGLLAIFPAIGAIISIAGLFLDPADVAQQLDQLAALLPDNAATIIQDQIVKVTGGDETATGLAVAFGILLALYGAMKGMKTLMEGMNIAYDETETRGFVMQNVTAFGLTLALILGLTLSFAVILVLPAVIAWFGLPEGVETVITWAKWPVLAGLTMLGLSLLYRFGPARDNPKWRWVSVGSVASTILWVAGTIGFSIYAKNFGSYNETYGTLGGVIILLTWLWLSSFIVLSGAELNSEMEHQTRRDSTTGPPQPRGQRGAVKADSRPEEFGGDPSSKDDFTEGPRAGPA